MIPHDRDAHRDEAAPDPLRDRFDFRLRREDSSGPSRPGPVFAN
jgi:hypothetical protein